jgi:hypothetical protein
VGGGLQRGDVVHRQECIVVLAEADLHTGQFPFDEAVTIQATPPTSSCDSKISNIFG